MKMFVSLFASDNCILWLLEEEMIKIIQFLGKKKILTISVD